MKLKYKISDDEISIYTVRMLQVFAVVFCLFYVLIAGAILWMSYYFNDEIPLEKLRFPLLMLLIFPIMFLAGNKRIIFKQRDEMVYKSFGFGRKEVAPFSEIASIQYVGGNNCYKIFLKSDPYGKGITITSPITGKELEKFEAENLPALKQMIFANHIETQSKAIVNIENLKYYTRKGNIFVIKGSGNLFGTILVVLIGLSLFIGLGIIGKQSEFLFVPIPILLCAIYMGTRNRFFDVSNRTLNVVSLFGKKSYYFEQFVSFRTVRNSTNGIYDNTSVELIFIDDKGNQITAKLIDIRNTKKIENFFAETKAVMRI